MKLLRSLLDSQGKHFHQGGRLEFAYPVYEMVDTFLYTPGAVTKGASHVRDGLDLKRMMMTVVDRVDPGRLHGDVQHRVSGAPRHFAKARRR